jgi:hypothetical protein
MKKSGVWKKIAARLGLEKPTVTTEQSKNSCTLRMFMSSMLIDEPGAKRSMAADTSQGYRFFTAFSRCSLYL